MLIENKSGLKNEPLDNPTSRRQTNGRGSKKED